MIVPVGGVTQATLDTIAWLFNIRSADVDYNPVAIAYAVVTPDAALLFTDPKKVDVKARMALSRRALALAPLRGAIEQGTVGFEAAMLVGRVATSTTVQAWLERARERTIKHLTEEVHTAEIIARLKRVLDERTAEIPHLPLG